MACTSTDGRICTRRGRRDRVLKTMGCGSCEEHNPFLSPSWSTSRSFTPNLTLSSSWFINDSASWCWRTDPTSLCGSLPWNKTKIPNCLRRQCWPASFFCSCCQMEYHFATRSVSCTSDWGLPSSRSELAHSVGSAYELWKNKTETMFAVILKHIVDASPSAWWYSIFHLFRVTSTWQLSWADTLLRPPTQALKW